MIIKGSRDAHKEKKRTPAHDGQTGLTVPELLAKLPPTAKCKLALHLWLNLEVPI